MYLVFNREDMADRRNACQYLDAYFKMGIDSKARDDDKPQGLCPKRAEIEAALAGALKVYYGLTLKASPLGSSLSARLESVLLMHS